jgi:glyoxylase-like metal-dependent hydrolase (beta-lactamase superfamily II)
MTCFVQAKASEKDVIFLQKPAKLAENLFLIDDYDLNMEERTGTYILAEDNLAIIETSASPSAARILEGFKALNLSIEDVKYIILTHIHLDHAGGAGLLLKSCPQAKVIVHPKGVRHLADPSRLIAGAKAVYGDRFEALFDPILPIPSDRLEAMEDGGKLKLSDKCTLAFFDTPGHANHHFSIYYPPENGMFTGDTAGIFYPQLFREGVEFYLPSTSPNQFSPEKMLASISLYESKNLDCLFFGHFGMSRNPAEAYFQVRSWLEIFIEEAEASFHGTSSHNEAAAVLIARRLKKRVSAHLSQMGIAEDHPIFSLLSLDLEVSAMGLADYLAKRDKKTENLR